MYPAHDYRKKTDKDRWKQVFCWHCPISSAIIILSDVLPYLRLKREQAETVIAFLTNRREIRQRRKNGTWGGTAALIPEEIQWRESLYQKMKLLNARGAAA